MGMTDRPGVSDVPKAPSGTPTTDPSVIAAVTSAVSKYTNVNLTGLRDWSMTVFFFTYLVDTDSSQVVQSWFLWYQITYTSGPPPVVDGGVGGGEQPVERTTR